MKALNIGCGPKDRWIPDTDGLDVVDYGQKYVGDFLKIKINEKFDKIYCHHFLEHIQDTVTVMDKIGDLLKNGGEVDIRVPLVPHIQAFQDPTHVKFIPGIVWFQYFTDQSPAGVRYTRNNFVIEKGELDRAPWELHVVMKKVSSITNEEKK